MEARANVKRPNVNVIKCTCSISDSRLKDITYSPLYKCHRNLSAHISVTSGLHNKYMTLCVYKRHFHLCDSFLPKKHVIIKHFKGKKQNLDTNPTVKIYTKYISPVHLTLDSGR